ncbi:MAG TPA: GNAT family N-acetyltransferase, partial [Myxococcota bacterium]|nr:GNAT family N-acetyltransferase [Myxococcota bacterium]
MNEVNEFNQSVGKPVLNWSGAKRPELKVFEGRLCVIEPIDVAKHSHVLFDTLSFNNQGESWTYLPYGPFSDRDEFTNWLVTANAERDVQLYAISNHNKEIV